ncbi:hypothetical protein BGZ76_007997 [Entomortierella beljakovae]|nr:hypothetical protein BGZ76_007997 [Entomortierella beljakovae]
MATLPDRLCGFHNNILNQRYPYLNLNTSFGPNAAGDKSAGFYNSIIIEYCPQSSYDAAYAFDKLTKTPWHPRANSINLRNPITVCLSGYEDVCCGFTDGERESDGERKIKITDFVRISSSSGNTTFFRDHGLSQQHISCFVVVPFALGMSKYFWVDLNKGIRAIYFPISMKYSAETQDLSLWTKLELARYPREYQSFSSVIDQSPNDDGPWKNAKAAKGDERGLLSLNSTIYVDMKEYITRSVAAEINRTGTKDPYGAVYWGYSSDMPTVHNFGDWNEFVRSYDEVKYAPKKIIDNAVEPTQVSALAYFIKVANAFTEPSKTREAEELRSAFSEGEVAEILKRDNFCRHIIDGANPRYQGIFAADMLLGFAEHTSYATGITLDQRLKDFYPEWINHVVTVVALGAGCIPVIGPFVALGIHHVSEIARMNVNNDWDANILRDLGVDIALASWQSLPDDRKRQVKQIFKDTAISILTCGNEE